MTGSLRTFPRSVIVLAFAVAFAGDAQAGERILGLLTLPEVFGDGPCDRFEPQEVPLFAAAEAGAVIASIRVDQYWTFFGDASCGGLEVNLHHREGNGVSPFPTAEHEYEAPAAIVLERRDQWFRLRLQDGSAWVRASGRDEYLPLQRLLAEGLTYLTEAWDGMVSATPGAEIPERLRVPGDPARRFVGLLELREPEGDRWIDAFEQPERLPHAAARFQTRRLDQAVETMRRVPHELLVFDTAPGWFQVALRRSHWRDSPRAWIEDNSIWRFHPIADPAERDRLADQAWGPEQHGVRVIRFRETADGLWMEVEVLSHSPCEPLDEPTVRARGWIPAHGASGEATVWFSSRGC